MTSNKFWLKPLASRIETAIQTIGMDLRGQCVLTEAASGPYLATAVMAAVAGAECVRACVRDSRWGRVDEIRIMINDLAGYFGVENRIEVSTEAVVDLATDADVVTNLGFVRPISREVVKRLPRHAAIALMWEPWEFRAEDVDLEACIEYDIPIVATNERHPYLNTFSAVGMLAMKLLFEKQCEVAGLDVLVVGSNPFGEACKEVLSAVGARVTLINPLNGWPSDAAVYALKHADACVIVEHRYQSEILGPSTVELVELLANRAIPLVHICGSLNGDYIHNRGICKHPPHTVPHGFMTLTTAYVGSKPVVDLHAAGLHVASIVSNERRKGHSIEESIGVAVKSGFGLKLLNNLSHDIL